MTPVALLSAWRHRWGKDGEGRPTVPYARGKAFDFVEKSARSGGWDRFGAGTWVALAALCFCLLCLGIEPTVNGQISLSMFLVLVAWGLGRFHEAAFAMALALLAAYCSLLYLSTRALSAFGQFFQGGSVWAVAFLVTELLLVMALYTRCFARIWPQVSSVPDEPLGRDLSLQLQVVLIAWELEEEVVALYAQMTSLVELDDVACEYVIVDGSYRAEAAQACEEAGIRYVVDDQRPASPAQRVACALTHCPKGLVMVRHQTGEGVGFVAMRVLPWFARSIGLALLHTRSYALQPLGQETLALLQEHGALDDSETGYALINAGAVNDPASTSHAPVAERAIVKSLGRRSSLIFSQDPANDGSLEVVKIDYAATPWSMRARRWLQVLAQRMSFFEPAAWWVIGMVPVAYFLWEASWIAGANALMGAQGLAHAVAVALLIQRCTYGARYGIFSGFTHVFLVAFVWGATALSAASTVMRNPALSARLLWAGAQTQGLNAWPLSLALLFGLNLATLPIGFASIATAHSSLFLQQLIYLSWSMVVLALLMGRLAVHLETLSAQDIVQQKMRMPVVLRSDRGRTVRAQTHNFPEVPLRLSLPGGAMPKAARWQLSFEGVASDVWLPVALTQNGVHSLQAAIPQAADADFSKVRDQLMRRDEPAPAWLPGSSADDPLPAWVRRLSNTISGGLVDVFANPKKMLEWIQFWRLFKKQK